MPPPDRRGVPEPPRRWPEAPFALSLRTEPPRRWPDVVAPAPWAGPGRHGRRSGHGHEPDATRYRAGARATTRAAAGATTRGASSLDEPTAIRPLAGRELGQ